MDEDGDETMQFIYRELQIEPTNRCNLKCSICFHTFSEDLVEKDLSCLEFKAIIHRFPTLERVFLQGLGEPFLNPELLDMVSYATKNSLYTYTTTNATLFNKTLIEKMISSDLQELRVSLDAVDKDLYMKIKLGSKLKRVIKNIELINQIKKQLNVSHPVLKINVVAMKDNVFKLIDLIKFAHKLDIREVSLIPLVIHGRDRAVEEQSIDSLPEKTVKTAIEKAKNLAAELKIDLVSGISTEKHPNYINIKQSPIPKCYYSMYIQSNGDLSPCCNITRRFGNVFEEEMSHILKNEKWERFRNFIELNQPSCHDCTRYACSD